MFLRRNMTIDAVVTGSKTSAIRKKLSDVAFRRVQSPPTEEETVSFQKQSFLSKCQRLVPKRALPYIIFGAYIILGSSLVHLCETLLPAQLDKRATDQTVCVSTHGYFGSLFYIMSASSTVGYGVLYPCSNGGKVVGALFTVLGLPVFLFMLKDIGKQLYNIAVSLAKRYRQRRVDEDPKVFDNGPLQTTQILVPESKEDLIKVERYQETSNEDQDKAQLHDLPAWTGIILSGCCFVLCAVFYVTQENYGPMESFYYSILTYITGDLRMSRFAMSIPIFALIVLGYSMLSLTLHLISGNIENAIAKMKSRVASEMIKIQRDIESGKIDPSEVDVDQLVETIMSNCAGPATRFLVSRKTVEAFKESLRKATRLVGRGISAILDNRKLLQTVAKSSRYSQTFDGLQRRQGDTMAKACITNSHQSMPVDPMKIEKVETGVQSSKQTADVSAQFKNGVNTDCQCKAELQDASSAAEITTSSKNIEAEPVLCTVETQFFGNTIAQEVQTDPAPEPKPTTLPVKYEWEVFAAKRRAEVKKTLKAEKRKKKISLTSQASGSDRADSSRSIRSGTSCSSLTSNF